MCIRDRGYDSLLALPGVGDATADNLYEAGFSSAEELAGGLVEELVSIPGISQQKAAKFIGAAKEYLAEQTEVQAEKEEAQVEPEKEKAEEEEAQTDETEKGGSEEDDKA
jgi:N utilization substance protein A